MPTKKQHKDEVTRAEEERAEEERLKMEAAMRIARLEAQWRLYIQRGGQWMPERK